MGATFSGMPDAMELSRRLERRLAISARAEIADLMSYKWLSSSGVGGAHCMPGGIELPLEARDVEMQLGELSVLLAQQQEALETERDHARGKEA